MGLNDILRDIEGSRDDIIRDVTSMVGISSVGPACGGKGESEIADWLIGKISGIGFFDSVERVDVPDGDVIRSNIIARKNGKRKGTVWFVSHTDTVHPGDPSLWEHPPFKAFVEGDRIYGLGAEDNGQGIMSTFYAVRSMKGIGLEGHSLGMVFVADEETGSRFGIAHLIRMGIFQKDDFVIVPDWGSPKGEMIDVAEKHILWIKVRVNGRQTHGSTPDKGLNAYRIGAALVTDLTSRLYSRYDRPDPLFRPPVSTFEPTKRSMTVDSINMIPATDEFWMDCRILPDYDLDEITSFIRSILDEHSKMTGAGIDLEIVQSSPSGPPSSTGTREYGVLRESIAEVTGRTVRESGIGGGTCANFFRKEGIDAYAWSSEGGSLHKPNEYVLISNIMTDAKVFATVIDRLCINS